MLFPLNFNLNQLAFSDLASRNQSLEEIKGSLEKELQEKSSLVEECMGRIRELEVALNKAQQETEESIATN